MYRPFMMFGTICVDVAMVYSRVSSCKVIDNPDPASERELVRCYAPSMPDAVISSLTAAFAELRKLNEEGIVAYPYSTREIVAVAKHLEQYPEDGVVKTLENVCC
jgi:von Willebrand factor A domain-containing protein 8